MHKSSFIYIATYWFVTMYHQRARGPTNCIASYDIKAHYIALLCTYKTKKGKLSPCKQRLQSSTRSSQQRQPMRACACGGACLHVCLCVHLHGLCAHAHACVRTLLCVCVRCMCTCHMYMCHGYAGAIIQAVYSDNGTHRRTFR